MAMGMYDGVRELRSRLPDVPDTVIVYYLSKYNVEECYERLKNGYDHSADMMEPDSSFYNQRVFENSGTQGSRTNAQQLQTGPSHSHPLDIPWSSGAGDSQRYTQELSPSHFRGAPEYPTNPNLPYPVYDDGSMPRSPGERRASQPDPDSDLLTDQRRQVEHIKKIRDLYTYDLSALRADAEHKRHTLTSLRLEVSEGPTILDTACLQDIIATLEYDIHTLQNKFQVEKTQAEMKEKLDVYTEEGVRWNCTRCHFLNHPLMTRCERCDQPR